MLIKRKLESELKKAAKRYPVIAIYGPRQSGKTTLSKMVFKDYSYVNLEKISDRKFAQTDPEQFLSSVSNGKGVILDEVQNVPELLSYIQVYSDANEKPGFFILTGSQNLLLNEKISQSLAGRVAIFTLLPFSIEEIKKESILHSDYLQIMFKGLYPRILAKNFSPYNWYQDYIKTYVERDVRLIKNITDLSLFQNFIELCAGRIGQLLNISSLASAAGISVATAKSWISILEASYIIFLIRPYHKNFNKRIVKSPKLYFYDTGLACSLLNIKGKDELLRHFIRGGLFESFVFSELIKYEYNRRQKPRIYFWRDNHGHEVDCIIEENQQLLAVEIKSNKTINLNFFDELKYWNKVSSTKPENNVLVYSGDSNQIRSAGRVLGWKSLMNIFNNK